MNKPEVLEYLKANQDARGIAHWKKHKEKSGGLNSFGIGLTKLRKFSKTIGRDPKLARQLWQAKIYEMKIIALIIDDPKTMTMEQAEMQVEQLQGGYLAHVFSSCDATLAKALNAAALRVAIMIGPIDFDPDGSCDPMDVSKHLTSSYVKEKLGL